MLVPQIEYLYYQLNVEGVTQKRAHCCQLMQDKTNNNCNISFNVPVLILLFVGQEKNQLKLYFFPLVPPNFWN